jgi:hypothetical protein
MEADHVHHHERERSDGTIAAPIRTFLDPAVEHERREAVAGEGGEGGAMNRKCRHASKIWGRVITAYTSGNATDSASTPARIRSVRSAVRKRRTATNDVAASAMNQVSGSVMRNHVGRYEAGASLGRIVLPSNSMGSGVPVRFASSTARSGSRTGSSWAAGHDRRRIAQAIAQSAANRSASGANTLRTLPCAPTFAQTVAAHAIAM